MERETQQSNQDEGVRIIAMSEQELALLIAKALVKQLEEQVQISHTDGE